MHAPAVQNATLKKRKSGWLLTTVVTVIVMLLILKFPSFLRNVFKMLRMDNDAKESLRHLSDSHTLHTMEEDDADGRVDADLPSNDPLFQPF